jgi:hypothetical protein
MSDAFSEQERRGERRSCQLFALVLARSDCSKELEILLLRHELSILRRQARRPQVAPRDRLVLAALPGSITSSTIASNLLSAASSSAASPLRATSTAAPSRSRTATEDARHLWLVFDDKQMHAVLNDSRR